MNFMYEFWDLLFLNKQTMIVPRCIDGDGFQEPQRTRDAEIRDPTFRLTLNFFQLEITVPFVFKLNRIQFFFFETWVGIISFTL